jgi:hypothetical protein
VLTVAGTAGLTAEMWEMALAARKACQKADKTADGSVRPLVAMRAGTKAVMKDTSMVLSKVVLTAVQKVAP